ncbi:MAG: hypothetical protein IPP67_09240 [Rhodospirillaceae bacterium]|nr:hypothetical protein [Rhodospirillaceae bacterium]
MNFFHNRFTQALMGATLLSGVALSQLSAQQYRPWDGNANNLQGMFNELKQMIREADRAEAADPAFLDDLNDFVQRYERLSTGNNDNNNPPASGWSRIILSDNFRDGDYTRNPAWTVKSGNWRIDTGGSNLGLRSSVYSAYAGNSQNVAQALLGALFQQPGQQNVAAQVAQIGIFLKIPNSFQLKVEFNSRAAGGRVDFVVTNAQSFASYVVSYTPGSNNGIQLLKVTNRGTTILASSSSNIGFEDGKYHVIELNRDGRGAMNLLVDNRVVARSNDNSLNRGFDNFTVVNGGGTYWIKSVTINGQ